MLIRCSRCNALWSLQDGVVEGAAAVRVECGRCQRAFFAESPKRAEAPRPISKPPVAERVVDEEKKALREEIVLGGPRKRRPLWIPVVGGGAALAATLAWLLFGR